jgi:phage terminase Nu1 subunit (DNA packaging protein)
MISQPMVVQLELGGWIKRNQNGLYVLVEFVQGFLRYREELQKRRRIRSSAATRLQEARALEIELRTARDAGELIELSEAIALAQMIAGETRAVFGALPARITRDLELRARIEEAIDEALNALADKLQRETAALDCSDGVDLSSTDDDAHLE